MPNDNINGSGFSVLDMANAYAAENDIDPNDIFKSESEAQQDDTPVQNDPPKHQDPPQEKKPWTPSADLLEGLDDLGGSPAIYDADEIKNASDEGPLRNMADDDAIKESIQTMDSLHRIEANIEAAKRRRGYAKLKIPPGQFQVSITAAAEDTNYDRSQAKMDEIFDEIEKTYPEFIMEWAPGFGPKQNAPELTDAPITGNNIIDIPQNTDHAIDTHRDAAEDQHVPENSDHADGTHTGAPAVVPSVQSHTDAAPINPPGQIDTAKVVIDKTNLPQVSWTQEDVDKIRRSRSVELNIIEGKDIEFGSITEADSSALDKVLNPYHKTVNDVIAALPASHYRATFTGLTFPEVLDLESRREINNIDTQHKLWSIAFNHIKNPSIGDWQEYKWYIDPNTKKKVILPIQADLPEGITHDMLTFVSKYEDFMSKTSYMDLNFIIWKILCATTMDTEIVAITCQAIVNGAICNNSYDWLYSPEDLLITDRISEAVLDEIKQTMEATSPEDVARIYNESPVAANNTVKLPSSQYYAVFGHASALDYVNYVYPLLNGLADSDEHDTELNSKTYMYSMLTCIKGLLIPDGNDGYLRVSNAQDMIKVINTLDEVDWQVLMEVASLMIDPYQMEYAIKGIVCPKCHDRSDIPIPDLSNLLFILARSLSSVQVTLKKV